MAKLLVWSRSASGRQHDLGAMDEGCFQIGDGRALKWVPESRYMFLSSDTCHDPDVGQILTITIYHHQIVS